MKPFFRKSNIALLLILVSTFFLIINLSKSLYGCFNGYDLGIYTQAILKLSTFDDLNPFVTIRGIKIFNDHFDPVILIPAAIMNLFGGGKDFLIFFEWIMFISFIPILAKVTKDSKQFLYLGSLYLLSVGVIGAVLYPIHASFWSIPVWALLVWSIQKDDLKSVLALSFILCLFKESYPFAILGLAIAYGLQKRYKFMVLTGLIAILSLGFVIFLRPILLGPVHGHGEDIIRDLINNHLYFFTSLFGDLNYKDLFLNWLPPGVIAFRALLNNKTRRVAFLVLFLTLPIFGIQFLANKFAHQYSFMWTVVWLTVWGSSVESMSFRKEAKVFILLLFVVGGFKKYELGLRYIVSDKVKKCNLSQARLMDIKTAKRIVRNYSGRVIATGGMSVALLDKTINLYQFCSHGDIESEYEMLVLEKERYGDIYPLENKTLESLLSKCKDFGNVRYESDGLLILEGQFNNNQCLQYREKECSQFISQN